MEINECCICFNQACFFHKCKRCNTSLVCLSCICKIVSYKCPLCLQLCDDIDINWKKAFKIMSTNTTFDQECKKIADGYYGLQLDSMKKEFESFISKHYLTLPIKRRHSIFGLMYISEAIYISLDLNNIALSQNLHIRFVHKSIVSNYIQFWWDLKIPQSKRQEYYNLIPQPQIDKIPKVHISDFDVLNTKATLPNGNQICLSQLFLLENPKYCNQCEIINLHHKIAVILAESDNFTFDQFAQLFNLNIFTVKEMFQTKDGTKIFNKIMKMSYWVKYQEHRNEFEHVTHIIQSTIHCIVHEKERVESFDLFARVFGQVKWKIPDHWTRKEIKQAYDSAVTESLSAEYIQKITENNIVYYQIKGSHV